MPIHSIQVSEYECVHCGYRWINRVNGKEGPCQKIVLSVSAGTGTVKAEDEGYGPQSTCSRSITITIF